MNERFPNSVERNRGDFDAMRAKIKTDFSGDEERLRKGEALISSLEELYTEGESRKPSMEVVEDRHEKAVGDFDESRESTYKAGMAALVSELAPLLTTREVSSGTFKAFAEKHNAFGISADNFSVIEGSDAAKSNQLMGVNLGNGAVAVFPGYRLALEFPTLYVHMRNFAPSFGDVFSAKQDNGTEGLDLRGAALGKLDSSGRVHILEKGTVAGLSDD